MADPIVPSYASTAADYAPSRHADGEGALVVSVAPESPADDLGILPGMRILTVNGKPLTDMIVWLWETDDVEAEISVWDPSDDTVVDATIERFEGEEWGLEFDGAVFDGIRTCVNACLFCFMSMLPKEHRSSLSLRDDDYRLSFLQGNFVTLTNMSDADIEDAIDKMLSPMNVSLHAITPEVRRKLIGRNAHRGIDALERMMDAGIEIHAQIVLCPGINDGDELKATLDWVERHEQITSLAVVPLGYTKHSTRFHSSFSEDIEASRAVVKLIEPYQQRARGQYGITRFQLSDEFYIDAQLEVPPAETYDGFPQFYDGIGMLRSFQDEAMSLPSLRGSDMGIVAQRLARFTKVLIVCGEAACGTFSFFCDAFTGIGPRVSFVVTPIKNEYFGGNVNVTGLICSCDLLSQLPDDLAGSLVYLPNVMFNYDGLTLDGDTKESILIELQRRGAHVVTSTPSPDKMLSSFLEV